MGRISNIHDFNSERQKALKLKIAADEAIIITNDELKDMLRNFLDEELTISARNLANENKAVIETRLNFKLKQLENSLVDLINERIDKITERVISLTICRVIDEEVNKRLKINK